MLKKWYIRAALSGCVNALLLNLMLDFSLSVYAKEPLEYSLVLAIVCAVIGSIAFMKLALPVKNFNNVLAFYAVALLFFLAAFVLFLGLPSPFQLRGTNNADGLLMMFVAGVYGLVAVAIRIIVSIFVIISKKYGKNEKA